MMTGQQLADKAKQIATQYKTCYVWGTFGLPCTEANVQRMIGQYAKNNNFAAKARALSGIGWMFDCVGLIKGILWGWYGDKSKTYGGAAYGAFGVPDISADQMISKCPNATSNFSNIVVGECVWMSGHIGIYIGDGLAVECTPAFNGGVQITAVGNISPKSGYYSRTWTKHGKMPYVNYTEEEEDMDQSKFNQMLEIALSGREELGHSKGWGLDSAKWAEDNKIVQGDKKGRLMYRSFVTREQLVEVLYRFFQLIQKTLIK